MKRKVEFEELERGLLIPLKGLEALRGAGRRRRRFLLDAVRELDSEHRREAKE